MTQKESWQEIVDKTYQRLSSKISNEKDFKQWMMSKESLGKPFDHMMVFWLYFVYRKKLTSSNDYVVAVVGREGSGKSTLAMHINAWIDPSFNNDRLCFGAKSTIDNFRHCKPTNAIQIDEAAFGFLSREAMTSGNRNFVKAFMAIRQKCFFITVLCPSFKDLDSYIRSHRIAMLIDIRERGKYQAYVGDSLRIINELLPIKKKISSIKVPTSTFWIGYWTSSLPSCIDSEKYLQQKSQHTDDFLDLLSKEHDEKEAIQAIPAIKVAKMLGMTSRRMRDLITQGNVTARKIGHSWFIPKEEYLKLTGEES